MIFSILLLYYIIRFNFNLFIIIISVINYQFFLKQIRHYYIFYGYFKHLNFLIT